MADCRVYPGGKVPIAGDGGMLHGPQLLFQVNHIFAIRAEFLAAVGGDSLPAFLLEGCGESLSLLFCALFGPGGRYLKGGRPGLELLPVRPPATVDTDGVGDQFAVFTAAFLNVRHCPIPPHERFFSVPVLQMRNHLKGYIRIKLRLAAFQKSNPKKKYLGDIH